MMSNTPYKSSHPYYEGPESAGQKRAWSQDTSYSREENRELVRRQVGKLIIVPMDTPESAHYITDMVRKYHIGGILLCRRSIRHSVEISRIVQDLQSAAREAGHTHPLFIMIEQENGMFAPFGNGQLGTQFPGALAVGAFKSSEILYDIARASAQELQSCSINTNLAPVLNIEEQTSDGLSSRTFGDDPANVWRCASAVLDAHRSTNIVSIIKHFPAPRQGSGGILDTRNIATEPRYAPFRKAFEKGVDGVLLEPTMWAASTDTTFGGKDSLPQNLIRKHLQYEGVLIGSVDRASENAAGRCVTGGQLSIRGFVNGCDMLILCEHPQDVTDALEEIYTAVETGNITRASLEQSWDRIRRVKERYLRWEEAVNPPPIHLTLPSLMRNNYELSFSSYEMATTVIKDTRNLLPLNRTQRQSVLRKGGTCVLLTAVAPPRFPGSTGDPFEYLGKTITSRGITVSHAPYTHEGLQETHTSLLKRANMIIFVLALDTDPEFRFQLETMRSLTRQRLALEPPLVVITACSPRDMLPELPFLETVVSCYEYSREALEAAASVIYGEVKPTGVLPLRRSLPPNSGIPADNFQRWEVHEWEKRRDLYASADLWKKCFGWNSNWNLNSSILSDLLDRPGNAKHYVVKDPRSHGKILGLCATYTIYAGKSLVGSMALLMVDPDFRNSGIGTALHDEAFQYMRANPNIESVQLGSIFPRFFPGLPELLPKEQKEWFQRRGWKIEDSFIFDLYQEITDWRPPSQQDVFAELSHKGITFGVCNSGVFDDLIQFEDKHFSSYPGWVEKYRALKDTNDYADAVIAFGPGHDGRSCIVGAALVFSGAGSNKISKEVPWPKAIGERVGGLACVGMGPEFRGRGVGRGLVCAAILELQGRGLEGCFVDWSTDRQVYEELGFKTHGKYHNISWRKV